MSCRTSPAVFTHDPAEILASPGRFKVIKPAKHRFRNGILVRMPNHLGDTVMALPALAALRTILPEYCALYVTAPAAFRPIFKAVPQLDGFLPLSRVHSFWSKDEMRRIRQMRFGIGVLFNNSLRDALLMRLAGVPDLYGAAARCRFWLMRRTLRFPVRHQRQGILAGEHLGQRYLDIVHAMGATGCAMPELDLRRLEKNASPLCAALLEHPRLMVIAAGAAYGEAKRWPEGKFNLVARYWIAHGGVVAVVGSGSEAAVGAAVGAGLPEKRVCNLCGKTGLDDLMRLLKSARVCVANDSGVMHLAAAIGTPGIAIFGSTDHIATGPLSAGWRILYRKRPCSPCFSRTCPRGGRAECLEDISVLSAVRELRKLCRETRILPAPAITEEDI